MGNEWLLRDVLKCGLVDLVESADGMATVRMSRPVLRLVANNSLLHRLLESSCTPDFATPELPATAELPGGHIGGLLASCRSYSDETQELAARLSWLVVLYAWLTRKLNRPPATLLALRPGALAMGNVEAAARSLPALERAAEAVDQSELAAGCHRSKTVCREEEAKRWLKLVWQQCRSETEAWRLGKEAMSFQTPAAEAAGVGLMVRLAMLGPLQVGGVLLGHVVGGAGSPSSQPASGEAMAHCLSKMLEVADGGFGRALAQQAQERAGPLPDLAPLQDLLACELLMAQPGAVPPSTVEHLQQSFAGEPRCLLVIPGERLASALGPVFGVMVARRDGSTGGVQAEQNRRSGRPAIAKERRGRFE
jgi:hypothetical protein